MKITVVSGFAFLALSSYGCATKKYVRQQIDPVTGRVQTVEQKSAQHTSSINDLENNVSQVNERAMGANKKAEAADQAAQQANQAAQTAQRRADEVGTMANQRFGEMQQSLENIDNFQQVSAETILFAFDKSTLTPDAKQKLDQLAQSVGSHNRYVIEVEGFTDRSGRSDYNMALSQRRADAVVRYLTMTHNIPLRRIHVLGAGEVDQQGRMTRTARKEARRVDVKIYGPSMTASNQSGVGSADRSNMTPGQSTPGSDLNRTTPSYNRTTPSYNTTTPQGNTSDQENSSPNTGSQVPRQ